MQNFPFVRSVYGRAKTKIWIFVQVWVNKVGFIDLTEWRKIMNFERIPDKFTIFCHFSFFILVFNWKIRQRLIKWWMKYLERLANKKFQESRFSSILTLEWSLQPISEIVTNNQHFFDFIYLLNSCLTWIEANNSIPFPPGCWIEEQAQVETENMCNTEAVARTAYQDRSFLASAHLVEPPWPRWGLEGRRGGGRILRRHKLQFPYYVLS